MTKERLRLLFLTPFAPRLDATNGGNKVIAQVLSRLSGNHDMYLVYMRGLQEPPIDDQIRQLCRATLEVIRPWSGSTIAQRSVRRLRLVASLIRKRPMWVTDWYSSNYAKIVRLSIEQWHPDIIQLGAHIMGQYLPAKLDEKIPYVLTIQEPGERAAPYVPSTNAVYRILNYYDRLAWRRYEQDIVQNVDAIVVFTEEDRSVINRLSPHSRVVKIPLGTEIPEKPRDLKSYPSRLLFFGSFIHPPNLDAALRLTRSIFPLLQACIPDLELYIVGDQPPPVLRKEANAKIIVTGKVESLEPYLAQASLVVAPLRLGGGMRVKILETLAAGKALVTTSLAIEGLALNDQEQVVLAESDDEFVQAILDLLSDAEKRGKIGTNAQIWARQNLNWEESIDEYEALYRELIENTQIS